MRAAYEMVALGGWRRIVHHAQVPFALGPDAASWDWIRSSAPLFARGNQK